MRVEARRHPERTRGMVILLFAISGFTALVYETVFSRVLVDVYGNAAHANSTVLAGFMGGMALGALCFGWVVDQVRRPLRVYAVLEFAVAIWALAMPALLTELERLSVSGVMVGADSLSVSGFVRLAVCFGVVLPGAMAIGGALPVGARALTRGGGDTGPVISNLYTTNTLGAAIGVLSAGYLLLPELGVEKTLSLTVVLNGLVGFAAWRLDCGGQPAASFDQHRPVAFGGLDGRGAIALPVLWIGAFVSGFVTLAYEIVWVQALEGIVGGSGQAFALIVFTFLTGLSLGSWLARRFSVCVATCFAAIAVSQIGLGLVVMACVPLWETVAGGLGPGLSSVLWIGVLLLPCTLMGMAFPLMARAAADSVFRVGRQVGAVCAANTVGAVLGSLVCGFVALNLFGVRATLCLLALLNMVVGLVFLFAQNSPLAGSYRRAVVLAGAVGILIGLFRVTTDEDTIRRMTEVPVHSAVAETTHMIEPKLVVPLPGVE